MGVHYDASWTNNRVHFVSPARGNNAARGGEGYSRRGTERERERERGGGAASPQTYITTRGILSLSPTLAILSPPRCSFVDFSSDREKRKIVDRWKRERERERKLNRWIRKSWKKERGGERSGVNERKKLIMESGEEWLDDLLTYWSGRRMEDWKMVGWKG